MKRRSFLQSSALVIGAAALPAPLAPPLPAGVRRWLEPDDRALADAALNAARGAGASYADIRISRHFDQSIRTRERRVEGMSDQITYGFGVRVLADGSTAETVEIAKEGASVE